MRLETERDRGAMRMRTLYRRIEQEQPTAAVVEDFTAPWQAGFAARHNKPEIFMVMPQKKAPAKKRRTLNERAVTFLNGYCYGGLTVLFVAAAVLLALGVLQ